MKRLCMALFLFSASVCGAETLDVKNATSDTIYKIYAWPAGMPARAYSINSSALSPGNSTRVNVDNSWGDCRFMVEYDPNNPIDRKRPNFRLKRNAVYEVNLCAYHWSLVFK